MLDAGSKTKGHVLSVGEVGRGEVTGRGPDSLGPMAKQTSVVDTVVSLCKRRGFVFASGEIYGGTRSA